MKQSFEGLDESNIDKLTLLEEDLLERIKFQFLLNLGFEKEGTLTEEQRGKLTDLVGELESVQQKTLSLGGELIIQASEYLKDLEDNKERYYQESLGVYL